MKRTRKMTKVFLGGGLILLFVFALAGQAAAQSWTQLTPNGGPPAVRSFHSAVYDPATNQMIVFGGVAAVRLNDLWSLSQANGVGPHPLGLKWRPEVRSRQLGGNTGPPMTSPTTG